MKRRVQLYTVCITGANDNTNLFNTEHIQCLSQETLLKLSRFADTITKLDEVKSHIEKEHIFKGKPLFEVSWENSTIYFNSEYELYDKYNNEIDELCDIIFGDIEKSFQRV